MNSGTARQKKVVLVVDDDRTLNRFMCDVLYEYGYNPIPAYEWNEASNWLVKINPDLVLLDFMLPDVNADRICPILAGNEMTRNIPIIIMSSLKNIPPQTFSGATMARCLVNKPFSINDLVREVHKAVGGGPAEINPGVPADFIKKADDFLDSYIRRKIY
jgi:DNA-binding response OmpR family regulator